MPVYTLLFIGGFGLCLLGFAFVVFMANRLQSQRKNDVDGTLNPLLIANELRNDIENIEWLTELLLKQEFGKLKIGQIELIDEIRRFSDHAAKQVAQLQRKEQNAKNVGRLLFPIPRLLKRSQDKTSASVPVMRKEPA